MLRNEPGEQSLEGSQQLRLVDGHPGSVQGRQGLPLRGETAVDAVHPRGSSNGCTCSSGWCSCCGRRSGASRRSRCRRCGLRVRRRGAALTRPRRLLLLAVDERAIRAHDSVHARTSTDAPPQSLQVADGSPKVIRRWVVALLHWGLKKGRQSVESVGCHGSAQNPLRPAFPALPSLRRAGASPLLSQHLPDARRAAPAVAMRGVRQVLVRAQGNSLL
jgi:hypothetical protein